MKRSASIAILCVAFLSPGLAAEPASTQEQELVVMVQELQAQQAQILENQAKIEAKLVPIAEAVRVARIYSSRGGN